MLKDDICKGCYWNRKIAGGGCQAFTERYKENCPGYATEEQGIKINKSISKYTMIYENRRCRS